MRTGNQRCLELPAVINGLMRRIAPIDGLTLFSLLGLIGLTLVYGGQLPRGRFLLFGYLLLLGFFLTLKLSSERKSHAGSIRGFVYDFSPILFVGTLIAVGCMVIGPWLYSRWNRFHKALTPGW